ncbi:MAG: amidohydrolase family protein [Steroidobacteraceae bacterium]|jgi:imidazolonepropionase-like amidohydrolase|nr:amidohydrolase family protein [Steroidobacteraceae bacterium]
MFHARLMQSAVLLFAWMLAPTASPSVAAGPPSAPGAEVLFREVRVFDGRSAALSAPTDVLVRGNTIAAIGAGAAPTGDAAKVIEGGGRTLMPGLIDAHVHVAFQTLPQTALLLGDVGYVHIAAGKGATEMLMRGFTSVRDLGGPTFGVKQAIDSGLIPGPRIWPSGAMVSQSGGHGDFRLPNELPSPPGAWSYGERMGAAAIADSPDAVRQRVREQLALGASQIKLMAGGGVSSSYDPLDVAQYSVAELRAAVEAAENWGTYVTVHAYTPRAVRQAIEAGVKSIDHGQLLDDATAKLMAEKGVWWSLQPFADDGTSTFPEGSPNRLKQLQMLNGTDTAYRLAKKHRIRTAFGTDALFSRVAAARQNAMILRLTRWYSNAEILRMVTADNAELLALSGLRSPYAGKLGVIEPGALADLLLVDGDPMAEIELLGDPARNFLVIMKDGVVHKNTLAAD